MMSQRYRERLEIAFGLRDRSELKAWRERGQRRPGGSSWYKSANGSAVGLLGSAVKSYSVPEPSYPVFGAHYVTDHGSMAAKGLDEVLMQSDGRHLYAGNSRVTSVSPAGQSQWGFELVKLVCEDGRSYVVERAALQGH